MPGHYGKGGKKPTAAHKKKIAAAAKKDPKAFKPVHRPAKRGR
jgi:hypothetical protein